MRFSYSFTINYSEFQQYCTILIVNFGLENKICIYIIYFINNIVHKFAHLKHFLNAVIHSQIDIIPSYYCNSIRIQRYNVNKDIAIFLPNKLSIRIDYYKNMR